MMRAFALVERDMRKFRRSPAFLFASLVMPLLQLIILGNAFGGNIKNVVLGVVNLDHGPQSVDVLERVRAVGANARTFLPTDYGDQGAAIADLRKGVLGGVLIIPQHYSRDLLERRQPRLALITDNTDRSVAGAVGAQMADLVASINAPKLICTSSQSAASRMMEQASFTSCRPRRLDPVILISTPRAPLIRESSSSGELMAWRAASTAAFSPRPTAVPIMA